MNDLFTKFFNEMTDGYFLDIYCDDSNFPTIELNKKYRWHGVCIRDENTFEVEKQKRSDLNCIIYKEADLKKCLKSSNHSGIIHYMCINNLTSLDYLKKFANEEYITPFDNIPTNWVRHIIFSQIVLTNKCLQSELIDLFDKHYGLSLYNVEDTHLNFVNKIYKDLL